MKSIVSGSTEAQRIHKKRGLEGRLKSVIYRKDWYTKRKFWRLPDGTQVLWIWQPTEKERSKGKKYNVICNRCGCRILQLSALDKDTSRYKYWDVRRYQMLKEGRWYGIFDLNHNVEGKDLKMGEITVSCCCGNSERHKLGLTVDKDSCEGFKTVKE